MSIFGTFLDAIQRECLTDYNRSINKCNTYLKKKHHWLFRVIAILAVPPIAQQCVTFGYGWRH